MSKFITVFILLLLLETPAWGTEVPKVAEIPAADLQFFGDVWVPYHALKATESTKTRPKLFENLSQILGSATVNIINFEGVSSHSFIPHEYKRFLLKMPTYVPELLSKANVHVASLANNHAMDYGYQGLFDTIVNLNRAGIATLGAGFNLDEAISPEIIHVGDRTVCLLAFSRTLPPSFWAKKDKSGTAYVDFTETGKLIKQCSDAGHFTVPLYHWGQELSPRPKEYQQTLARLSIRSGADLVIGHHPHILQTIEWYQDKPIFYSLGNFTFGSIPLGKKQEGMAVRVRLEGKKTAYDIVPINVNNDEVKYKPRLFDQNENDPVSTLMPPGRRCQKHLDPVYWTCI